MQQPAPRTQHPKRWWRRDRKSEAERRFLQHLDLIDRAAGSAARRSGFAPEDVEDFVSTIHRKLIEDDYAIIRKHRGTSRLSTYLTTVVHHAFHDWRNAQWGRFRPSSQAQRLGPLAIQLEQLLVRDQLDLRHAVETLRQRAGVEATAEELHHLAAQLPARLPRLRVGEEALRNRPSGEQEAADRRVMDDHRATTAEATRRILEGALEQLDSRERLVLRMHFGSGFKMATIARTLGVEQRSLYTMKDRSLRRLNDAFRAQGLTWDAVRDILGWAETPLPPLLSDDTSDPTQQRLTELPTTEDNP